MRRERAVLLCLISCALTVYPRSMLATMDAMDYGQLNVVTYVCSPSMCDDTFWSMMIDSLYHEICVNYYNNRIMSPQCDFVSIDCGAL